MAQLLDGKAVRDVLSAELSAKIKTLKSAPTLVIIQVGDRPDSTSYINQKKLLAKKIGAKVMHKHYADSVAQAEILKDIQDFNINDSVHGIIIQLPLPESLDKGALIETVAPGKDVDGLTAANAKFLLESNARGIMPATTRGIISLLEYYKISIAGRRVTVVGRSSLVGKPTAIALLNRNATVTIAHSKTADLKTVCKEAEILIVAMGKAKFITADFVSPGQTVIDVGINALDGKMVGDVDFAGVQSIVAAISPVPGGVGPMTVVSLFQNLVDAYLSSLSK